MQFNAEIDARQEAAMGVERMERKKKRQSEDKNQSVAECTKKLPKNMDSENNGKFNLHFILLNFVVLAFIVWLGTCFSNSKLLSI